MGDTAERCHQISAATVMGDAAERCHQINRLDSMIMESAASRSSTTDSMILESQISA